MQYRYTFFLLAAGMILYGCVNRPDEKERLPIHSVFAVTPEPAGLESVTVLPATVEESRTISVGFKTSGQIEKIFVKEGEHISKGQIIAELDSEDYAIGVSVLREKCANLKSEIERLTKLYASGNVSDNDYEKAISGLRQLELQLRVEENRLGYCRLFSPSSGIVTKVNFEESEMADAGTPVIDLMDTGSLEAVVDLPVRLYTKREYFSGFIGESSLYPDKDIRLNLLSLTPRADNTQLYRLRLGVPPETGFTPGMNIKVKILSRGDGTPGFYVPLSSVFEDDGKLYVWKINSDSTVTAVAVSEVSTSENGYVNIVNGITGQDRIVRAGVKYLVDGEKVRIVSSGNTHTNPGDVL